MLFDKAVEDRSTHTAPEEEVAKRRLRIERGEFERELENLRKENDFLKKDSEFLKRESEFLKKERRRKSMDTEKGERLHNTLERQFGSPRQDAMEDFEVSARRKFSWDLDRDRGESTGDNGGRQSPHSERMKNSFIEREELSGADKETDGADRSVERRRWDMEREIEMEKWKRQGQHEKDQERTKWKLERDKELERLKKYQESEKVNKSHSSYFVQ